MNIKKQMDEVRRNLEGKTFNQLATYFKEWEESGYFNVEIDNMLMDLMEAVDEERFIEWAKNY